MRYAIIGSLYFQESLSTFHEGLDNNIFPDFKTAYVRALEDLHLSLSNRTELSEVVKNMEEHRQEILNDPQALEDLSEDHIQVAWLDDDRIAIEAMDQDETYQMYIEVVPVGE